MELICSNPDCGLPIERHDDLINYYVQVDNTWRTYHRACYAKLFNAPHALLDENGIAKIDPK